MEEEVDTWRRRWRIDTRRRRIVAIRRIPPPALCLTPFLPVLGTPVPPVLTALRVLEIMVRTGKPLADLVSDLKVLPQTIRNVRVREKVPFAQIPAVRSGFLREIKSTLILQPGPAALTDGLDALAGIIQDWHAANGSL